MKTTKAKVSTKTKVISAVTATLLIAGAIATAILLGAEQPSGVPGSWQMVWQDEFTTSGLGSDWYLCPIWYSCSSGGGTDQGVKAQAWFLGSAASAPGDGYLHLTATKLSTPRYGSGDHNYAHPYSSGYIITGKQSNGSTGKWYQYGVFETRMKCPNMLGSWCAFWTWGDHSGISMTYPNSSNEIDVTENLANDPFVQNMNLHGSASFSRTYRMAAPNSEWHIYAVDWEPGYVKWYVDGTLVATYSGTGLNNAWMYPILSLQLGGTWAGSVDESKLPAEMLVDYVRVWKQSSGPTATPGATLTPSLTHTITLTRTATTPPTVTNTRTPTIPPTVTLTRTPTLVPSSTPTLTLSPTIPAGECHYFDSIGRLICVP